MPAKKIPLLLAALSLTGCLDSNSTAPVVTTTSSTTTTTTTTTHASNIISGDFAQRYSLDESDLPNWKNAATASAFGPEPAALSIVTVPALPADMDEVSWRQKRLVAALDYWIDQGLNYCHHHIPLWTPPADADPSLPIYRISNGQYARVASPTLTYSQTCTPARRLDKSQTLTGIKPACDPANGITTNCCKATDANCIDDPNLIQWNGLDCSDFTSWIYNFSFGIDASAAPMQTGIGTQACNGKVPNKSGVEYKDNSVLLNINHKNFDAYSNLLKPGDLLYILPLPSSGADIVHVVVWTGLTWGDIKSNPAYYIEQDGQNFGAAGDRVGGDFKKYGAALESTPLIVDSHYAGPAYRPFLGWYRQHLSHVRRVIGATAAATDSTLAPLKFSDWSWHSPSLTYRATAPGDTSNYLEYAPDKGATQSCLRPAGFNDGSTQ